MIVPSSLSDVQERQVCCIQNIHMNQARHKLEMDCESLVDINDQTLICALFPTTWILRWGRHDKRFFQGLVYRPRFAIGKRQGKHTNDCKKTIMDINIMTCRHSPFIICLSKVRLEMTLRSRRKKYPKLTQHYVHVGDFDLFYSENLYFVDCQTRLVSSNSLPQPDKEALQVDNKVTGA